MPASPMRSSGPATHRLSRPEHQRWYGPAARRARYSAALQVALLLSFALVADHGTGPLVTAGAFYVFGVALAGWRFGWLPGLGTAVVAFVLNAASEWSQPDNPLSGEVLITNELLRLVVFLAVGGLSASLANQQQAVASQRDELERLTARLQQEMRAARAIQELLTSPPPEHAAIEAAVRVKPALILGGDAADLALTPDGYLVITLADVSGKGGPAALAGAVLAGMLDQASSRYQSPAEGLRELNDRLVERLPDEMFVTVFYGLLDLERGELVYASGGHEEPLVFRGSRIEEVPSTGMALGVLPNAPLEERRLLLQPGDLLFGYTDGATDVKLPNGERLGSERLRRAVAERAPHCGCRELLQSLENDFYSDPALASDDVTLIAVRYRGPANAEGVEPGDASPERRT